MAEITVNGVTLDIDIFDFEVAQRYESATDEVISRMAALKDATTSLSEGIKLICITVFDCFNAIFGVGTDKKVFGETMNLKTCLAAYGELTAAVLSQRKGLDQLTDEIKTKCAPNRAAHRAKK